MYKTGCAKTDITVFIYGKGMMGYGAYHNVAKGIETPVSARAFVISHEPSGRKVALVNAEICFYTLALKDAVVRRLQAEHPHLGYSDRNVMLTAQHTHSAQGGYSHYILYNLTIQGFQQQVFDRIVEGTVQAIVEADSRLAPTLLRYSEGEFAPDVEVAFNRSLPAYNANPEILVKAGEHEAHLAIDRTMKLLRFDNAQTGQALGSINWFGVHTTSLSNDNSKICYDNKGYAADFLEKEVQAQTGNQSFVAAFAQDIAGDVTPNYIWDEEKKWTRGKYKDDFKSARHNGHLQYQKARELFETAKHSLPLQGEIDYELVYVDFSHVNIDPVLVGGRENLCTVPSAQGISFFEGTKEGPGMSKSLGHLMKSIIGISKFLEKIKTQLASRDKRREIALKYAIHGKKRIFMESAIGKVVGISRFANIPFPSIDEYVRTFKKLDRAGYLRRTPWIPQILPIQIFCIGNIALLGLPAEITTIAGKRLAKDLEQVLAPKGIQKVLLATYANGYHGYITTPEEYDVQLYEGGHTVFGKWTLPAYQTKVRELAKQLLLPEANRVVDRDTQPDIFRPDEIWYGFDEENKKNEKNKPKKISQKKKKDVAEMIG